MKRGREFSAVSGLFYDPLPFSALEATVNKKEIHAAHNYK